MTKRLKWAIDPQHSEIAFKVRHLMISNVKGTFKTFDASIYTTDKDFTTVEIDLWIDAGSVNTGDAKRDEHLSGPDFFDAQVHKQISFTASTIGQADPDGNRELWGELTVKGVTKDMRLMVSFGGIVKDPWGKEKAGFTVSGSLKRSEWGLMWNTALDTGGVMLGDEVKISCELQLVNVDEIGLTMELEPQGLEKSLF